MGVGAAASEPGTLSIIRHVYPDRGTRADALGVWAAVSGLALALGPVIAGVLVGVVDWRAIFWFNLAIGAVAFVMALVFVPESSDRQGRRFDVPGIVLGAVALACLSFGIIQGEQSGYATWWIVLLFAGSVAAGVVFVVVEHRSRSPMLRPATSSAGRRSSGRTSWPSPPTSAPSRSSSSPPSTCRWWPTPPPTRRPSTSCRWPPP